VINEEDEARLSPLVHGHVNMLGHYAFTLSDAIKNGELLPLIQPIETVAMLNVVFRSYWTSTPCQVLGSKNHHCSSHFA